MARLWASLPSCGGQMSTPILSSITSLIDVTSGEQTMVCRDRKILVTAHSKRGKYVPSWMTDDSMIHD